jgi:hypothetical protein
MFFLKHVNVPQLMINFFSGIGNVFIEFALKDFQKFITWVEKSKKGQQE